MAKYIIKTLDGEEIPIKIVKNLNFGGTQQTIVYESAGTNGGVVVVTGRTTNSITLNGTFLATDSENPIQSLNEINSKFIRLRDKGNPIILIAPIDNDDTGNYIITEYRGNIVEGVETYLPFSMTLIENRQVNIRRTVVNLISSEPKENFIQRLKDRQIVSE